VATRVIFCEHLVKGHDVQATIESTVTTEIHANRAASTARKRHRRNAGTRRKSIGVLLEAVPGRAAMLSSASD
jgi:hypothetical protein